jgi:hypothetical protein
MREPFKNKTLECSFDLADIKNPKAPDKGTREMRKASIRTVKNTIGLARSVANGTTKFPFLGYCADLMEKMLEEIKQARKAQEK